MESGNIPSARISVPVDLECTTSVHMDVFTNPEALEPCLGIDGGSVTLA